MVTIMEIDNLNKSGLLPFIFSTKAISGKLMLLLTPLIIYLQNPINADVWGRLADISVAVFVLAVGMYILWKEYRRQDDYSKEQYERIIGMAERTALLAETSVRATENSTEAIKNMTKALERIFDRLDNISI